MKRILLMLTALFISSTAVNAATTVKNSSDNTSNYVRGYGNSFIFAEAGIEFSVFPDGQFDFYMSNYGPNANAAVNAPGLSISFNSGYDYNPYLQYDEFGAIIQIQNVPVYYDFYGRVSQVGNIFISYNRYGYVSRVGGLNVYYNNYNRFSYCTGFINPFNRFYVYRPWHTYYRVPAYNNCVIYNRPYRQFYTPVRYSYTRPYTNNYRRTSAVASRRGTSVNRSRNLATRGNYTSSRRNQVVNSTSTSRRNVSTNSGRSQSSNRSETGRPVETTTRSQQNAQATTRGNSRNRDNVASPGNQRNSQSRNSVANNSRSKTQVTSRSNKSSRSQTAKKINARYEKPKAKSSRANNADKNKTSRSPSKKRSGR